MSTVCTYWVIYIESKWLNGFRCSSCVFSLCCQGSGVLVAMLLVGGGGGACCCHGGRGPEGGGGGWLLGGGGGGGIMPIGGGSRPTRKTKFKSTQNLFVYEGLFYRNVWNSDHQCVLTDGVSMRSWTLAHGGRRGLHPGGRQAIGVGGHRRASHVGHGGREAVGSSMAAGPSMHAMEVPVFSWTRAHPRRPVLLHTVIRHLKTLSTPAGVWNNVLATYRWWLVIVGSWGPRSSSLGVGVSPTWWRDWSLPQLCHEGQILLVHTSLVLCWLRRLATSCSVGSEWATQGKTLKKKFYYTICKKKKKRVLNLVIWSTDHYLVYLQSEEMWPAPPHLVQRVVFVMLRGSEFCQGRRILQRQRQSTFF